MTDKHYTFDDVERLSRIMKAEGVHQLELPGLKLIRSPQADAYREMAERAAALHAAGGDKPLTPEELLNTPFKGIPGHDPELDEETSSHG